MVFNATFNNISVISWTSVLLVEETKVPRESHWPAASHWQTLLHNVVSSTPRLSGVQTDNVSGEGYVRHSLILSDKHLSASKDKNTALIGIDCIGSYKSDYHMITTTTAPFRVWVMLIIEDPTVVVKCRTEIKALFLHLTLWITSHVYLHP